MGLLYIPVQLVMWWPLNVLGHAAPLHKEELVSTKRQRQKGDGLNIKPACSCNSIKQIGLCSLFLCIVENIHGIFSCGWADSADSRCIKNIKSKMMDRTQKSLPFVWWINVAECRLLFSPFSQCYQKSAYGQGEKQAILWLELNINSEDRLF